MLKFVSNLVSSIALYLLLNYYLFSIPESFFVLKDIKYYAKKCWLIFGHSLAFELRGCTNLL